MTKQNRTALDELVAHFDELEDPRSSINRQHPLVSVVVVALMAVLAGAEGPTAISVWAKAKRELLCRVLDLPHGIPSRDVFRRVLMAITPAAFQACFYGWLASLQADVSNHSASLEAVKIPQQKRHIAIDGKSLRGSHDRGKGLGPLHLVSAWLSDCGLTLGQVSTPEKSNEITAIPELLKLIDCKGAIITIDAMGTQTAIVERIIKKDADFVLALKKNQSTLHDAAIEYIEQCATNGFSGVPVRHHIEEDQGHGRKETRTYIHTSVPIDLKGGSRWSGLKTIGMATRTTSTNGVEKTQVRFYISSLSLGVKQFARAVRSHWGIENSCHWSLDVTYREDALRTRNRTLAENLAWLRRFTLSLIKQHPHNSSQVMKRRMCGWSDDFMMEVLLTERT